MNAVRIFGSLSLWLSVASPMALAASDVANTQFIPEKFIISRGPAALPAASGAEIEKSQAVDGSTYTVVTPLFTGADGNNSFLRFPNYENSIGTNLVYAVGAVTGTLYGSTVVAPQPHASPQLPIATILTQAGVNATTNKTNEAVTLYIRNSASTAAYQHVIYNATSNFFENMSVCNYLNSTSRNYRYLNSAVFNVHTTQLASFPSYVTVHNYSNQPVLVAMDVYEAATGDLKGTYSMSALANTTYAIPFTTLQNEVGWSPFSTELHANIIARTPNIASPGLPPLVLGQYIYNESLKTYVNMSTVCPINYGNQ